MPEPGAAAGYDNDLVQNWHVHYILSRIASGWEQTKAAQHYVRAAATNPLAEHNSPEMLQSKGIFN